MFFGTRKNMKSVTAAELAAAGAWRVVDVGDRVGAVVFDYTEVREVRPHRSRRTVLEILHLLVEKNGALEVESAIESDPAMLNRAVEGVARVVKHDALVVIISDFDGADEETTRLVTGLAQHNDVLAIPVYAPSSTELPAGGRLVVSDGELQVELDIGKASTRKRLAEMADRRLSSVMAWQDDLGVPVMPISAGEDSLDQVRTLLGQAAQRQRR